MWNMIQDLPNNPAFVLVLIAVTGYVWFNIRRWAGMDGQAPSNWWAKHISGPFPTKYNPKCFDCNLGNDSCPDCRYLDPDYRD